MDKSAYNLRSRTGVTNSNKKRSFGSASDSILLGTAGKNNSFPHNSEANFQESHTDEMAEGVRTVVTVPTKIKSSNNLKMSYRSKSSRSVQAQLQLNALREIEEADKERSRKIAEIKRRLELELTSSKDSSIVSCSSNNSVVSQSTFKRTGNWVKNSNCQLLDPTNNNERNFPEHRIPPSQRVGVVNEQLLKQVSKLLTRQVMGNSLVKFGGSAIEWPEFKADFDRSTRECGFTDAENLQRLRQALYGEAREEVKALLLVPGSVSKALEVLERKFGKPENIVKTCLKKLEGVPFLSENDFSGLAVLSRKLCNSIAIIRALNLEIYLENPILVDNLVQVPFLSENDFSGLAVLSRKLCNSIAIIRALNLEIYLENPILVDNLVQKLNGILKFQWAEYLAKQKKRVVSLLEFGEWVQEKETIIGSVEDNCDGGDPMKACKKLPDGEQKKQLCTYCKVEDHVVLSCEKFKHVGVQDRRRWAIKNGACFRCLRFGHVSSRCKSKGKCESCDAPHHSLLHPHANQNKGSENQSTKQHSFVNNAVPCSGTAILFKVVPVKLFGPTKCIETYAFLDEGSSVTLLQEDIANDLGLTGPKSDFTLRWTSDIVRDEVNSREVSFGIQGISDTTKRYSLKGVKTVKQLALPLQSMDSGSIGETWKHIRPFQNQITSYQDAKPKLLIGLDNWHLAVSYRLIYGPWNGPTLSKTALGWVVSGKVQTSKGRLPSVHEETLIQCHWSEKTDMSYCNEDNLDLLVKTQFSLDVMGVSDTSKKHESKDNVRARQIFSETTSRIANDRWETGLLWKDGVMLPDSKKMAWRRLMSLERRMDRDPVFSNLYVKKMEEYFEKGYARRLTVEEANKMIPGRVWYLPHLGVTNPNKIGKLRIVFDAAAKSQNMSLNDALLQGPDLLINIPGLLWRFREYPVAIVGDIREMYSQIKIIENDRLAQRFLWRGADRVNSPQMCRIDVMLFGAVCSPFSAQQVRDSNAEHYKERFPRAVEAITKNHYMDDYLDSVATVREAISLAFEVQEIHRKGGFEMCSWMSNSEQVMKSIPQNLRSAAEKSLCIGTAGGGEKILGMWWKPETDYLLFRVKWTLIPDDVWCEQRYPTKREFLRFLMAIFDPLGILAPIIIDGKILMQSIWKQNIKWDERLNDQQVGDWKNWVSLVKRVEDWRIPRCYGLGFELGGENELHVFCDASESAFATSIYFRARRVDVFTATFVTAKARVAPLKFVTVPRLELQAALMGTRLCQTVLKEHTVPIAKVYYWTDSMIVLSWIRMETFRLKTLVANRVEEIQQTTDVRNWRWVPTAENAADLATKILKNKERYFEQWLQGPVFLRRAEDEWPKENNIVGLPKELVAEMRQPFVGVVIEETRFGESLPNVERFSNFDRLIRATARAMRFIKLCRRQPVSTRELAVDEVEEAEQKWIKYIQSKFFHQEIIDLKSDSEINGASKLRLMCPFLDKAGILRVGSRIGKVTDIVNFSKFPVILPREHRYTRLLVEKLHRKLGHQGSETLVNETRQHFWIIRLRSFVRQIISQCMFCRLKKAKPIMPLMGDLPKSRLSHHVRPFTNTGLDYFGPLMVKVGRRREKRYGALFTCLTIRAIHIELVDSLTSDSAIMAIRRMAARRGCPKIIWSDNGTNLKGANRELREELHRLDPEAVQMNLAIDKFEWRFIPPGAPHMGGAWERLIRSVKVSLNSILKERESKEEVLRTVLAEVENIVNSHPFTHVSDHPEDQESLTPNHILIGEKGAGTISIQNEHELLCLRRAWWHAQQLADQFWIRWTREYLPTLTCRQKWSQRSEPIKVGDLVIIVDSNGPRNFWPRGVVRRIFPDKKGQVRNALVETQDGLFTRPTSRIAVLDVKCDLDEDVQ